MSGKKKWYIVDGYRPAAQPVENAGYEGHECILILNTNPEDAQITINVYYADREPVEGIALNVPAKRILVFRSTDKELLGNVELGMNVQYSMEILSNIDVIVQYGRMDVQQSNLAYIALLGYGE